MGKTNAIIKLWNSKDKEKGINDHFSNNIYITNVYKHLNCNVSSSAKYNEVLEKYKDIKVMRWNEAREYELSKNVKRVKPKEIKIDI